MSGKLIGYRFSPTVQEVLHTIEVAGAPIELQNVDWGDAEQRKTLVEKTPTKTFPYLETNEGILSESKAIEIYIAEKYKPELLGEGDFEQAQVRQWMDFASFEIGYCAKDLVYPIFGWAEYNKSQAELSNKKVLEFMRALDQQVKGKRYVFGEKFTLADIALFRQLKFFFQLVFPKGLREKVFPNVNDWFQRVINTPEADKVYGKIILCNSPLKPPVIEKKMVDQGKKGKKDNKDESKKENKKVDDDEKEDEDGDPMPKKKKENPLDLLPPSKLELESFKREFLNNKDIQDRMKKFWEIYDPEGYSLWKLEYQNLPTEGKVLFRTSNSKSMFLQKMDNLRKYGYKNCYDWCRANWDTKWNACDTYVNGNYIKFNT